MYILEEQVPYLATTQSKKDRQHESYIYSLTGEEENVPEFWDYDYAIWRQKNGRPIMLMYDFFQQLKVYDINTEKGIVIKKNYKFSQTLLIQSNVHVLQGGGLFVQFYLDRGDWIYRLLWAVFKYSKQLKKLVPQEWQLLPCDLYTKDEWEKLKTAWPIEKPDMEFLT